MVRPTDELSASGGPGAGKRRGRRGERPADAAGLQSVRVEFCSINRAEIEQVKGYGIGIAGAASLSDRTGDHGA